MAAALVHLTSFDKFACDHVLQQESPKSCPELTCCKEFHSSRLLYYMNYMIGSLCSHV